MENSVYMQRTRELRDLLVLWMLRKLRVKVQMVQHVRLFVRVGCKNDIANDVLEGLVQI